LFLPLLMASACKKETGSTASADSIGGSGESFVDSLCMYRMGDYGSQFWRIPALLCLDDGTLLAVNDKRKYSYKDLPEDIDIVCRRSRDMGNSWSEPQTIVEGTGYKHGYGDPALVQCENGDVLCFFVGGNGLWASTESDPIRSYVCRSTDRGLSWSTPEDITSQLWGSQSVSPSTRNYKASFFGSGNALRLRQGPHKGRILVAAAMCRKSAQKLDNFVVYSDDNGHSWQVSDRAFSVGDEAKLVELNDGTVLISVRQGGPRGCNRSSDGGKTWGTQSTWPEMTANACNGDLIRINDTTLIHSLPNSMNRENVSVFISNDEGSTWHSPHLLVAGPSVYSSLTRLADGSVGCFVEVGPDTGCELWFYRFNPAWLK
jgi:sialidase-1